MGIAELKALTQALPPLGDLSCKRADQTIVYEVENGTAMGFYIYKDEEIAVQRVFMSGGATFPLHKHEGTELIFTISGHWEMITPPNRIMEPGSFYQFGPGVAHGGVILADTWIICLTMPPDTEGYPNGKPVDME